MEQKFTITTKLKSFDNLVNWLHKFISFFFKCIQNVKVLNELSKFKQIIFKIPFNIIGLKIFFYSNFLIP
jgi:hypothetical protein